MDNLTTQLADLTKKRKKWVEANRENGFEEGITNLLTELYPDNAHFIYELLQNAEDTHADSVSFNLSKEDVRFEHNGGRLFNLKDVESITSIGKSTKRNDPTNIGKFGVGFKAVFAYTNTPEIHSGDYQFKIHNLVVPEALPNTVNNCGTAFLFPFDNPKKAPAKAVEEIDRGLRALAANTLLFLNSIQEIKYQLPNVALGKLKRVDVDSDGIGQHIEIHSIQPEGGEVVSNWLRYRKEVFIKDEADKTKKCQVAIAFRLEPQIADPKLGKEADKTGKSKHAKPKAQWIIVPCEPGQVSIFFPAEKETSNLRFHMHAPFASTVARDSVRDCESNQKLRDALAQLTAEAMIDIRDRGLLTMSFLAVLPNQDDGLSEFYQPIRRNIVKAFEDEDLLPTKSGSYLKALGLYRGPSEISSVIDDDDLSLLTDYEPPLWSANASQKGQREDKFLDSLQIEEWGWEELKEVLKETEQNDEKKSAIEQWISGKQDNWLMRFYALNESCHLETENRFDRSPLNRAWSNLIGIRVTDCKGFEEHVSPCDAYFPQQVTNKGKNKSVNVPTKIRLVKPDVYEKGRLSERTKKAACDFLQRIGVREYNELAEIEARLARYSKDGANSISEKHYQDIRAFIAFLKGNPDSVILFKGVDFLLASEDTESELYWTNPADAFLDDPYESTGLGGLTAIHEKRKVWPDYLKHLGKSVGRDEFIYFLKTVGVAHRLEVTQLDTRDNKQIHQKINIRNNGINIDWTIDKLEKYLKKKDPAASRLIWLSLLQSDRNVATAKYQPNQRHDLEEAESQLVQHLKSYAWIPDKSGNLYKPKEMTLKILPKEFPYDDQNGLLTAIGFGEKENESTEEFKTLKAFLKKMGFKSQKEVEEALKLLKAKHEGRIRVVSTDGLGVSEKKVHVPPNTPVESTADIGNRSVTRPLDAGESQFAGVASPSRMPMDGDANMPPVLRRISARVCEPKRLSVPVELDGGREQSEDDDDYTPASVDYSRRIARAEERNATEIERLEREQELLNIVIALPRYCYGWFRALLELECMASSEKHADSNTISISFGRIEKDVVSSKTIILKEPSRFIPQSVEDLSGVRVDLQFDDGRRGKLHMESLAAKEFSLLGKLKSVDELNGMDLSKVVEARIDVKNPSFLLKELLSRFNYLGFEENFDMKANLTRNIEFIFGPPGTGKTTHLAEKVLIPLMRGTGKSKVLVLTPTNKAADVLTTRIMEKMGSDNSFRNWLVRFGTSTDERIEKEGVWRDRSFDIGALDRSVTVSTIARFAYDGFATEYGKLHEMEWDAIVFDEASMIPLVNIIYPLYQRKAQKFIVAGDPFQIEPIVSVDQWKNENIYTLVGLNKPGTFAQPSTEPHDYPVTNLETQYRSVPAIGEVFSRFTYSGILKHYRGVESQRPLRIDGLNLKPLNLIKFPVSKYESIYRAKRLKSGTPYQIYSALFTFEFVRWLAGQIQTNHSGEPPFRIGIIAPYRAQANLLSKLNDSRSALGGVEIQVGTIHGFQGDECDIIIAVFNPPPTISANPQMFLNKKNILNVAISRARDYLFIVMPEAQTEGLGNLRKVAKIEDLVRNSGAFNEYESHAIEDVILGNARHLEENTFSTGHQMVNVYRKPERYYEVRSDDMAIDIQIHEKG
jgi:hypothetical protein